jgi:hypothetical protein
MSGKLVQEEDRIAIGKIIVTAVVSLAIFGIGVIWSISIQRNEMHSIVTPLHAAAHAAKGAPEVGIVYQWPFNMSQFGADKAAETKARLQNYRWADSEHKVVRIPIDEAMKKYVAQAGGGK